MGWTIRPPIAYIEVVNFQDELSNCRQGTILVYENDRAINSDGAILYARVSSNDRKEDLKRQLDRLKDYASAKGIKVVSEVQDYMDAGQQKKEPRKLWRQLRK